MCRGISAAQLGDTPSARADAAVATRAFERLSDAFFLGLSHLRLGLAQLQLGDFTAARTHLEASRPALRDAHDWKYTGVALIGLGSAARAAGRARAAARAYAEAFEIVSRGWCSWRFATLLRRSGHSSPASCPARCRRPPARRGRNSSSSGLQPTFPGFEQTYRATARLVADGMQPVHFAAELDIGRSLSLAEVLSLVQDLSDGESSGRTPVLSPVSGKPLGSYASDAEIWL